MTVNSRLTIYKLLVSLIIFFISTLSYANISDIKIIKESTDTLVIQVYNNIISFDTIYVNDGQFYIKPNVHNSFPNEFPETPFTQYIKTYQFAVPEPFNFNIKYSIRNFSKFEFSHNISGNSDSNTPETTTNDWVTSRYLGIARNLHIAELKVFAYQYFGNFVVMPDTIDIEIIFKNPPLNHFAKNDLPFDFLLNPNQAKFWQIKEQPLNFTNFESKKLSLLSNEQNYAKIKVCQEGIYKIDAQLLNSLGFNIPPELVKTIKIFGGHGRQLSESPSDALFPYVNEIPIIVNTKPNGELDYILFYGVGTSGYYADSNKIVRYYNIYGNCNYYFLTYGSGDGLRAETTSINCSDNIKTAQNYIERIFFKEEITNPYNSGSGRTWFGSSIFPRNFVNLLQNLDRSGVVSYYAYVSHKYSTDSTHLRGQFSFYEGNNLLGKVLIEPNLAKYTEARAKEFYASIPASMISSDNRSYFRIDYTNPEIGKATPFFNAYEIQYPRLFYPIDNSISFFSDTSFVGCYEFHIPNFNSKDIVGLDVTNPLKPKLLENISVVINTFSFRYYFQNNEIKKFFVSSNFLRPDVVKISFPSYLFQQTNADVIIITHSQLLNSATKYKEFREKTTNYRFLIATVEDIYNAFSSGIADPTAIRNFIAYAFHNWENKPKYVVLWGDGHFDYKNLSTKQINYIPAFQSPDNPLVFDGIYSFTTDDYYVYVNGNDPLIDISIARIPVYDDKIGELFVSKLISYENSPDPSNWNSTILLTADDSPTTFYPPSYDGNQHTYQSEILANGFVGKEFYQKKIYLVEYPVENVPNARKKPLATQELIQSINRGAILVNWVGHGNPRVWAHEELFDRDKTISALTNRNKLFFGIAATCDFARFDMIDAKSGTEELLFWEKGGAIGIFSATRLVYVTDNASINQEFFKILFSRSSNGEYKSLGDVYYLVKQGKYYDNDKKYLLFADPLLKLKFPNYFVKITHINGISTDSIPKDSALVLKALSKVEIRGQIIAPSDGKRLENFTGSVDIMLNDVSFNKQARDIDGSLHTIRKEGGIVFRGVVPVNSGSFTTEFIIPEELSFLQGNLNLRCFAKDSSGLNFALGYFDKIRIDGFENISISDTIPPTIEIFINDTTFRPGDIVGNQPLLIVRLSDNSGINTTGRGIGHRLEAWIDDSPLPIDLTEKFEASFDNPRIGYAKAYLYGLSSGEHNIKIRAWDIFNNFSVNSTTFRIIDSDENIMIYNTSAYPNPATNNIVFRFQHNLNEIYKVKLKVYSVIGEEIYSKEFEESKLLTVEIPWNLMDNNNNIVPDNVYLFSITIESSNKQAISYGKFVVIKGN